MMRDIKEKFTNYIPKKEKFVTRIGKPKIYRLPNNTDKNSFDKVFIKVNISKKWEGDKSLYAQEHMDEIKGMVFDKIKNNGINTEYLKIISVTLKEYSIEFILKKSCFLLE